MTILIICSFLRWFIQCWKESTTILRIIFQPKMPKILILVSKRRGFAALLFYIVVNVLAGTKQDIRRCWKNVFGTDVFLFLSCCDILWHFNIFTWNKIDSVLNILMMFDILNPTSLWEPIVRLNPKIITSVLLAHMPCSAALQIIVLRCRWWRQNKRNTFSLSQISRGVLCSHHRGQ